MGSFSLFFALQTEATLLTVNHGGEVGSGGGVDAAVFVTA